MAKRKNRYSTFVLLVALISSSISGFARAEEHDSQGAVSSRPLAESPISAEEALRRLARERQDQVEEEEKMVELLESQLTGKDVMNTGMGTLNFPLKVAGFVLIALGGGEFLLGFPRKGVLWTSVGTLTLTATGMIYTFTSKDRDSMLEKLHQAKGRLTKAREDLLDLQKKMKDGFKRD